jgi:seryl-tRNA synthetase
VPPPCAAWPASYTLDLSGLEDLMARRSTSIQKGNEVRAESKQVAAEVQTTARQGGDPEGLKRVPYP